MKRNPTIQKSLALLLGAALLPLSCASGPETRLMGWKGTLPGGRGRNAPAWELTVSGENGAVLSLPYAEKVLVTGEAFPGEGGSWIVYTDGLDWFGSWHRGWTEARFSLTGSFELIPRGGDWQLKIREKPEITGLTGASLRLGEERVYGDRSRDITARRWARISRAAEFAGEILDRGEYPLADRRGRYGDREPAEELEELFFRNPEGTDRLPEDLIPVVESGTLYGDYEAAGGLFYLARSWDSLWDISLPHSIIESKE